MKLLANMTMYLLHLFTPESSQVRSEIRYKLLCCSKLPEAVENKRRAWILFGFSLSKLYLQCSPFVWRLLKEIVSCWSYDKVKLEQESWWKALWESNLSTYLFAFSILLQARQRGLNFLQILQKPYCAQLLRSHRRNNLIGDLSLLFRESVCSVHLLRLSSNKICLTVWVSGRLRIKLSNQMVAHHWWVGWGRIKPLISLPYDLRPI